MTNTFQFYQAGSLVVDLMQWPYFVTEMTFNSPDVRTRDEALSYEHGVRITTARYNNVGEELTVLVAGSTQEDVSSNLSKLEKIFNESLTYQNNYGDEVFVKARPDGVTLPYRSRVLRANILESEGRFVNANDVLLANGVIGHKFAVCKLAFTREYYWEAWDLVDIPLTNGFGTDVTTGCQVYSHDDADLYHDNWVLIKAQHVLGSLPAPLRVTLKDTFSDRIYTVWMGHNAYYSPSSFQHIYEAEDGTKGAGVTEIVGAYSNGKAVTILHSTGAEFKDLYWSLTTAQLGYARGRWFKILASVITNNSTSCKMKMVTSYQGVTLQETGWSTVNDDGIFDLGTLRLPPTDIGGIVAPQAITLELWSVGSSYDIDLDWIMLIPAEDPEGVVKYTPMGYGLSQNSKLLVDGADRNHFLCADDEVSGGLSLFSKLGRYLDVLPGRDQRLYFTWTAVDFGGGSERWAVHVHTASVQCRYRPRRLKI